MAFHRNDTIQNTDIYVKLVGLIWQYSPPDRINIRDPIQQSKIYAPLSDQDTTKSTSDSSTPRKCRSYSFR